MMMSAVLMWNTGVMRPVCTTHQSSAGCMGTCKSLQDMAKSRAAGHTRAHVLACVWVKHRPMAVQPTMAEAVPLWLRSRHCCFRSYSGRLSGPLTSHCRAPGGSHLYALNSLQWSAGQPQ